MFKNLNTKLLASIFLLLCIIIVSVTFTVAPLNKMALALSPNYSKTQTTACTTPGSQLCISDWNNLDDDFLARNGGNSMGVDLDMGGHGITNIGGDINMGGTHKITNLPTPTASSDAATKGYFDNIVMKDANGSNLKVVCGETTPYSTAWQQTTGVTDVVWVDVDTSPALFNSTMNPVYFTNLSGDTRLFRTYGVTSVYFPDYNSFRVYVVYKPENGELVTPTSANNWGWHVKWCGYGRL
jgi:hypothetical protein